MKGVMRFGKKGKLSPSQGFVEESVSRGSYLGSRSSYEGQVSSPLSFRFHSSLSVFACRWNSVQSEIHFSVFSGQTTARAGGPWFTTAIPPQPRSEKSAKS
ncbi:hypothetical protein MTR67_025726 [Solanum verrucosum]|uniref:Uncharacterized protein n=1 Tax=Solanum verrucosum TaxID=315347 RepID=A0AAF0QZ97_SOLVR|nr:hypothetical protein MTR67_025726 [Solanum verrucosum]